MFTIEILKCHEQKIGVTPNPQKTRSPEAGGISQEGTAWRLTAVSSTCQLRMAQNGSKFWPNAPSAIIDPWLWRFSMFFSILPRKWIFSIFKNTRNSKAVLGFSIPKHGFSQQVQSGSLSSIVLWEDNLWPCHPRHWTSILMLTYVDPLISWQAAVKNSPFTIIYFDDLPNLSQKSLKMVIFQFANCYSSHYQRLCLKRPIRSNHTQVQTRTQMRPSIFFCVTSPIWWVKILKCGKSIPYLVYLRICTYIPMFNQWIKWLVWFNDGCSNFGRPKTMALYTKMLWFFMGH